MEIRCTGLVSIDVAVLRAGPFRVWGCSFCPQPAIPITRTAMPREQVKDRVSCKSYDSAFECPSDIYKLEAFVKRTYTRAYTIQAGRWLPASAVYPAKSDA